MTIHLSTAQLQLNTSEPDLNEEALQDLVDLDDLGGRFEWPRGLTRKRADDLLCEKVAKRRRCASSSSSCPTGASLAPSSAAAEPRLTAPRHDQTTREDSLQQRTNGSGSTQVTDDTASGARDSCSPATSQSRDYESWRRDQSTTEVAFSSGARTTTQPKAWAEPLSGRPCQLLSSDDLAWNRGGGNSTSSGTIFNANSMGRQQGNSLPSSDVAVAISQREVGHFLSSNQVGDGSQSGFRAAARSEPPPLLSVWQPEPSK